MLEVLTVQGIATRKPRIFVVGDIMLDHYVIGDAVRISPEAPVPVLLNPRDEYRLGGAGAVAAMCQALGASTAILGSIGTDAPGQSVKHLLLEQHIQLLCEQFNTRPTTVKMRICGLSNGRHRQQLTRIDMEDSGPFEPRSVNRLLTTLNAFRTTSPPDLIIVSDYGKGVVTDSVIQACRDMDCPVLVDPARGCAWPKYYGVTCVVPNRDEAGGKSARDLCRQLQTDAAVVKLDVDGCELFERGQPESRIPTRARIVHDVTGAGDQFIAAMGVAIACKYNWQTATLMANAAAGLQVERHGCDPVTLSDLRMLSWGTNNETQVA